ncbi:MAG: hypothetical protein U0S50_10910 [Sphingopyxis sp.]|uniref:hypothetical protein n=1 Tax=Sphingopyxis sp. TaxID=1908224 RepID=UPI002AB895E4|nr:hypothetical protein [Sphingopyxis sp.]MDZ3832316.1 hypothetical protein [Sphingopyxis sp.]
MSLACAAMCGVVWPTIVSARDCGDLLQDAATAVASLPSDIPYQVPDQLQAHYDEASELVRIDEQACLAVVTRMRALIARYMPSGGGSVGRPGLAIERDGGRDDNASPADPEVILADLRDADAERVLRRMERSSEDEAAHLEAVGEYRDAAKAYVGAMHGFAVAQRSAPSDLSEIDRAAGDIDAVMRAFEQIVVVNAPDDVMHAKLEDAVRRVEEARQALERAWQRYHARKASAATGHIAPLSGAGFEPAPLVRDFIAPLGDAETRAAQSRLRQAERTLKQVRNDWNPHVHRSDLAYLDMREGYKQAYKTEHKRFADALAALDATLGSYLPDRIAAFHGRRVALSNDHERRLDAIFERYAIRG